MIAKNEKRNLPEQQRIAMVKKRRGWGWGSWSVLLIILIVPGLIAQWAMKDYEAMAQASEGISLANALKATVADNLKKGICGTDSSQGQFVSSVTVSGMAISTSAPAGDTGCRITIVYKLTGISSRMAGTTLVLNVLNNGHLVLGKQTDTPLPTKYIPQSLRES